MINFNEEGWINSCIGEFLPDDILRYFNGELINIILWLGEESIPQDDYEFTISTYLNEH